MHIQNIRTQSLGYIYVVLAASLWAASGSVAKFLFHNGVTPFQLVQLRTTISTAVLFAWLLVRKRRLLAIERKDLACFILLGGALAVSQITYLYAISKIQVAAAILLQYQSPVLIAAYAVLFMRQRLAIVTVISVVGAIAGCYLMVGGYNMNLLHMNRAGIVSGLLSAVAFALYSVRSEYGMRTYTPWTVVFYSLLIAALIWNIFHPPLEAFTHDYSRSAWWGILFIGVFGTIFPFVLYTGGINLIRATHASITATLEPVMAGVIAYFFLGEIMELWQMAGAGLVIASILLLQIRHPFVK